jgi:hypothetical protein
MGRLASANFLLRRVICGDQLRKTRLHNYQGERIDAAGLRFLPACICSKLWFVLIRRRPHVPWLGYRATLRIGSLLTTDSTVLEFGSGMSTLWFARRCRRVVSIETNPTWHTDVMKRLARADLRNADCRLVSLDSCATVADRDQSFDFALVDGYRRDVVVSVAIRKVRPGGFVYLDNCDVPDAEHSSARHILLGVAKGAPEYFTDFAPCFVAVTQGMLVRI